MTAALPLLTYAAVLATAGGAVLRRAAWTRRAPRLAILAWFAVALSAVGSVLLAGLTVATQAGGGGGARRCDAPASWTCSPAVTAAGNVVAVTAGAVTLVVAVRLLWCLTRTHAAAAHWRREQLDALALLGRADARLGVTVVDHAAPAAYCLPGRHGRVVVTTAALAALDEPGLAAVLAHERAHLFQRHHLLRATAEALAAAFPCVPALQAARAEIAHLTELAADDAAARGSGRLTVAAALLALAEATPVAPAPALTAGGTTAAARARRLIAGERPLSRSRVLLGLAAAVFVLAAPVAAVAASSAPERPAAGCCTVAQHTTR
jgi:Zn-dependent protease with chaperone function